MDTIYPANTSLKEWAEEDRPREKLLLKGKSALSDSELLAIILRNGLPQESVTELSKKLLAKAGNDLHLFGKLSVKDILDFKIRGIGETKAITLVAAMELGRRRQSAEVKERKKITSSKDVFEIMHPELGDLPHEEFWVLLLNRANQVIEKTAISQGGITGTVADIRLLFEYAIKGKAVAIILSHNHPSGNTKPSTQDVELTNKVKDAGNMLDIKLLDHVIVADKKYLSFSDEGLI